MGEHENKPVDETEEGVELADFTLDDSDLDQDKESEGTEAEPQEKFIIHTDRTRVVAGRRCKRYRFWGYEFKPLDQTGVPGIRPQGLNIPITIGSAVHQGLETLHRFCKQQSDENLEPEVPREMIDYAVKLALDYYNGEVVREEVLLEDQQDIAEDEWFNAAPGAEAKSQARAYKISEGRAQVEALVRAYALVGLPQLLDRYQILMVEEEMSKFIFEAMDGVVQLNGRADAVLRDKLTGALAALSIKTPKKIDYRAAKNQVEDDQGISECLLIEELAARGAFARYGISEDSLVQVGVQMLTLLKGYEKADDRDGIWKAVSGLIRPYGQESPGGEMSLRPKWNWIDDTGAKRTLGKGWRVVNIWETGKEIKDWLEELLLNEPGVVEGHVLLPEYFPRTVEEMQHWQLETGFQERQFAGAREDLANHQTGERHLALGIFMAGEFPMNRSACNYPVPCEFKALCHPVGGDLGMSHVGEMLVREGLSSVEGFVGREANHPQEGKE